MLYTNQFSERFDALDTRHTLQSRGCADWLEHLVERMASQEKTEDANAINQLRQKLDMYYYRVKWSKELQEFCVFSGSSKRDETKSRDTHLQTPKIDMPRQTSVVETDKQIDEYIEMLTEMVENRSWM